jgi:hypothetical protein
VPDLHKLRIMLRLSTKVLNMKRITGKDEQKKAARANA